MRVLVTGITGFVGSHLAEYLLSQELEVYGILRWRSNIENIDHILDKIKTINADIRDGYSLLTAFRNVQPDYCFHLAAQSFVLESWNAPLETMSTNVLGAVNVLEAIRLACPGCVTVIAGSSEEYGLVYPGETPIKETNPLRPMSPYGVSKVAIDKLGCVYFMSYGLKVFITRAFNHTGPRRGEVFATSNFAKQIAEIEANNRNPVIKVGNLDARRDFTDVRDVVKAYWLAATRGIAGEVYNICSERTVKIGEMLNLLMDMSETKVNIERDESRMRPSDVPVLLGDCSKFREATGWKPVIPFKQTLEDLLDYWRQKVRK